MDLLVKSKPLIQVLIIFFGIMRCDTSIANDSIKPRDAIQSMIKYGYGNAITTGSRLKTIYHFQKNYLFYHTNEDPELGHISEHLVVFLENKYHHDYHLNQSCKFRATKQHLICYFTDFPGSTEKNRLSDVFAGKKLLIGGSEVRAWQGPKEI